MKSKRFTDKQVIRILPGALLPLSLTARRCLHVETRRSHPHCPGTGLRGGLAQGCRGYAGAPVGQLPEIA